MNQQDKIVKNQAILREYEVAARRHREPKFIQGEGNVVVGSVFDCNRKGFEKALRAYWDRLYVGWNPYKKDGRGCWEVWQRPLQAKKVLKYEDSNFKIFGLEYKPNDFEHWVADLDFLSYSFIEKLRAMDTWENRSLVADHDDAHTKHFEKLEREEDDNIKQVVKENKSAFRDLLDYTQMGYNPLDFFNKR